MLTSLLLRRALVALLFVVPLVATGGTAQATGCSGSSGVTVIVQFPDHTETGCATGDPSSGADALESAGFSLTPVTGQPFVCRINQMPRTACGQIPPSRAYWAYFHASRGGSWTYTDQGAWSADPAPGSVEGWRFGGGAKPSMTPPAGTASSPTGRHADVSAPHGRTGPDPGHGAGTIGWWWGLVGVAVVGGAAGAVTLARRR